MSGRNVPNQPAQGRNAQQQGNQAQNNPAAQNPDNNPAPVLPQNPQPANPPVNNPVPHNPPQQWGAQPRGPQAGPQLGTGRQAAPQQGVGAPQVPNPVNNPAPVLPQNPQPANPPVNNPVPHNPPQQWGAQPRGPQTGPQLGTGRQAAPQQGVGAPQVPNPVNNPAPVLPQNPQPANALVNNPGLAVPQQLLPVRQPPNMASVTPKDVADVDQVKLKVRRWSVSTLSALGLNPRSSQDRVLASTVATAARIDESSCQRDVGPYCSTALKQTFAGQLPGDPAFNSLVDALEIFENSGRHPTGEPKARGTNEAAPLRRAAAAYEQSLRNLANPDPTKQAALDEVKRVTRAFELRGTIVGYGKPPWTSNTAKQATKAKIELDIMSMPAGARSAQPPPGSAGGVNQKVWIQRRGGTTDATGIAADSYICKPASGSTVDGIPRGGEAAREALVQRAGGILSSKLGIDLNIPETHSIALDNSVLPPNLQNPNGRQTACSVQELRPNEGPAAGKSKLNLAKVPTDQVHGLIALDVCTLNLDRHSGNLLMDEAGGLVPIDHGSSLPQPLHDGDKSGLERIRIAMPSPHNALLRFPQAHEAMSDDMRKKMGDIKPGAIKGQLAAERDAIAQEMGQADNTLAGQATLSDAALDTSERAMEIMKLAARDFPALSPAAVQVALGKRAITLLDPAMTDKVFHAAAKRALEEAVKDQAVIKEACLMNTSEQQAMKGVLYRNGWNVPLESGEPSASLLCDPALALKLALTGVAAPNPTPSTDRNSPRTPPPTRSIGQPGEDDLRTMKKEYGQLTKQTLVQKYQLDLAEEWAAFKELGRTDPEQIEQVRLLKIVVSDLRFPTTVLRAVQQMRQIKNDVARAERQAGGALPAVQAQLVQFKINEAQQTIGLLRGPIRQEFGAALTRVQGQGPNAVTAVSDLAFERVRTNLRTEVTALETGNTITAQQLKALKDAIEGGYLAAADQLLNALPNYNRPNSV